MKRTLAMGMVTAALCAALAAGCASNPASTSDDARLASKAAGKTAAKEFCVRDTGTRIKVKEGACVGAGRTFTQEELERTGSIDTAEALRRLDPRIN